MYMFSAGTEDLKMSLIMKPKDKIWTLKKETKDWWLKYFFRKPQPNFEGHAIEGHLAKFVSSHPEACENLSERGEQCHEGLGFEIEFP